MSEHTPGTWQWWTSNSWNRLRASQDHGRSVADVLMPHVCSDGQPTIAVSAADMALIQAAPDMKAVLEELEAVIDRQTFEELKRADFDPPEDREFSVNLTVRHILAITRALSKSQRP